MSFLGPSSSANRLLLALSDALKADHGFNTDSRSFRELVQVMSSYNASTRREFLQFMTGSPKLPIGGQFLRMFGSEVPCLIVVSLPRIPWADASADGRAQAA